DLFSALLRRSRIPLGLSRLLLCPPGVLDERRPPRNLPAVGPLPGHRIPARAQPAVGDLLPFLLDLSAVPHPVHAPCGRRLPVPPRPLRRRRNVSAPSPSPRLLRRGPSGRRGVPVLRRLLFERRARRHRPVLCAGPVV